MRTKTWACRIAAIALLSLSLGTRGAVPDEVKAQAKEQAARTPQFKYDPSWPKPLPDGWVLGSVGSVCVDSQDHVFAVTRGLPELKERSLATPAPPVIEFDRDGNVVN